MLVLIKVGDYLTYRYTNNLEMLGKEFSEYTPKHEFVVVRDDSYYYFDIIPKMIPDEFKYKLGWFYDRPEIRDLFQNYKKGEGSYFKSEFSALVKNSLSKFLEDLYGNLDTWGASRIKDLLGNDIRTLDFSACPDLVNAGDSIQVKCRQFPVGSVFRVNDVEVVFDNITTNKSGGDPQVEKLLGYVEIQREIGGRPNIEKLEKALKERFTKMVMDSEKENPYLLIDKEGMISVNLELSQSYREAQNILIEAMRRK